MVSAVRRRLYMLPAAREIRSHPFLHIVIVTAAGATAKENIASKSDNINAAAARSTVASSITASMSV